MQQFDSPFRLFASGAKRTTALLCLMMIAIGGIRPMNAPLTPSTAPDKWPATFKLGLIPTEGGAGVVDRFQPLIRHLEDVLGVPVEVSTASDYSGVITAMQHGHIDAAYLGPKSYVAASERAGAQAVAMEISKEKEPGYFGIIISRKGSGIESIADARGKTFAFTDPNSTSGYLVPNLLFARDMSVDPDDYFSRVRFSGSHGASILSVRNGTIDVAATNSLDLARMIEKGQAAASDFNVLWESELIPGSPMVIRRDLPRSLKAAYLGALIMFNDDEAGLDQLQTGGFIYATDEDYDVIRYLNRLKDRLER